MCLNIQQIYCYYILKDGIMQFSSAIVDFYLFSDGSVDMQIWTLLSRSQCRVSDTEVTVKAWGPLVSNLHDCLPYHTDLLIFVLPWFVKTKQFETVYLIFFLHMYMCIILAGLASSGYVQINLPLEPSKTYFSTVRGVTNGGNVLETSSDGFTVDQTPPTIHIDRWPSRPVVILKSTVLMNSISY